jgi:two-component system response regulator GlrR
VIQIVDSQGLREALHALARLRLGFPCGPVLVIASALSHGQLLSLMAAGAADFVCAPFENEELLLRVERLLGRTAGAAGVEGADLRPQHPALRNLVGDSPAFAQQVARVPLLARYDAGVLILGETGTGKEAFAHAIHYLSERASQPWVAVNSAAIPVELIEAELFGHVKGAYTHAVSSRGGLVREAEGGTLFLDEIDSLPYSAQAKLLRFLQDKEYRPVGSSTVMQADVRVVAASNRDLPQLAARGVFRQDLFFRLNVLPLHLPPLRERRQDIPKLALFFLRAAARQWHRPEPSMTPGALQKLLAHEWPGNVRELKNVIERAVLLSASGPLRADDIDLDGKACADVADRAADSFRAAKARVVENFERSYIEHLLNAHGGNVTHAAKAAGKNRRAFFELMRKYKIASDDYRSLTD